MNYTCITCGQLIQLEGNDIPEDSTCPQCFTALTKESLRLFTVICTATDCRLKSSKNAVGDSCPYCARPMVEYTKEEEKKDEFYREANRIKDNKPSNLSLALYCIAAAEILAGIILAVKVMDIYLAWGISAGVITIALASIISHLSYMAQERTDRLIKETLKD